MEKMTKKVSNLIIDRILVLVCTVLVVISTVCTFYIIKHNGNNTTLPNGDSDINNPDYGKMLKIEAEYNIDDIYEGTYLNKNSVKVYGIYENGAKKLINRWTGVLGPVKLGNNTFTIEYEQYTTQLSVTGESLDNVTEVRDYITYDFDGSIAEIIAGEVIEGNVTFDDAYSGVLMCGDSRTLAISTMKVLAKDKILAKNGVGLDHLETYMQMLLSRNPETIILNYGVNSISEYENARIDLVERYKTIIQQLQMSLPNARIIVAAVFPVTDYFAQKQPRMNYIEDLNLKLLKMCIETNVEFVDSTHILEKNQFLFNPDGLHFDEEFYKDFWLVDLIVTAGIGTVNNQ